MREECSFVRLGISNERRDIVGVKKSICEYLWGWESGNNNQPVIASHAFCSRKHTEALRFLLRRLIFALDDSQVKPSG